MELENIRINYPITLECNYLNHAARSPVSIATLAKIRTVAEHLQHAPIHHESYWNLMLEHTREKLAALLNAKPYTIAFFQNTSTALSVVALALSLQAGDKILVPEDEFPSNRYIWQNLQEQSIDCEFFAVPQGMPIVEVLENINLRNVKLISISAVNYKTGRKYDLKAFTDFCQQHQIYSCIDAIQAVGATNIDVETQAVDFLAGASRKWLIGPPGCGYLYINPKLIDQLHIPLIGWHSARNPENYNAKVIEFAHGAKRFEPGETNILTIAGLNASLDYLSSLGWNTIFERINYNVAYLHQQLAQLGLTPMSTPDAGIVSFEYNEFFDQQKHAALLVKNKISVTLRDNYVRVSPHFYTTQREIDQFLNTLVASRRKSKIKNSDVISK